MSPDDDEPYTDPLRAWRHSNHIYLNSVDGVPWASDSYWAVEVPDAKHPVAVVLDRYNIAYDQPATVNVWETLILDREAEPKDIEALVIAKLPEVTERVERRCIQSEPVFLRDSVYDKWLAVFDRPGGKVGLANEELVRLVERMTMGAAWFADPDPITPMVRKVDGRVVGCLMGVRHKINGTAV